MCALASKSDKFDDSCSIIALHQYVARQCILAAALLLPGLASAAGLITSSAVGPIANTIQAFWAGSALVVLANAGHKVVFNNTFSTIDLFHLAIALFDGYSVILPLSTVAMLLVIVLSQAISITTDHPSMLNLLKAMYDKVQSYFADNKNDDTCRKVRVLGKLGMAALSTDFLSVIAAPKRVRLSIFRQIIVTNSMSCHRLHEFSRHSVLTARFWAQSLMLRETCQTLTLKAEMQ